MSYILRVPVKGGTVRAVTALDRAHIAVKKDRCMTVDHGRGNEYTTET